MRLLALPLFALALPAFAQDAPPPASAPAAAAETPPAAPVNPLAEPFDIVENAPNTKENLRKAIALYDERLKDASLTPKQKAAGYADQARAWVRLGDLETAKAAKLAAYEGGRAAAQKGMAADPKSADALFWDMAAMACVGRTNGVMNSLFMLGDLRKGLNRALELDPRHSFARQVLGDIDHAVPGIAGGSDERAEKAYLEVLRLDPNWTPSMKKLAEFYRDKGEDAKAREWANKVLSATKSSAPSEWKKFDKKDAQKVLKELEE